MTQQRWQISVMVVSLLMFVFFLAGCPKRPASTTVAAPPSGASPAAPAPAAARASAAPAPPGAASPSAPSATVTPPSPKEFVAVPVHQDVHFDFDKYEIRREDGKILDQNAKWMKGNPNYLILVEGHADERGTDEYNLALGERRAKATMNYLVSQGVQASRITLISYGEERSLCTEKNETCWARNRRAHFLVKGK